jgi:hypothetical protein
MTSLSTAAAGLESRLLKEAYGPGAWHGPDLKAALSDVAASAAYWRPGPGRHNIAEIALHHAFYVRSVRAELSGAAVEPFALDGQDWFTVNGAETLSWPEVLETVRAQHERLATLVADIETARATSPIAAEQRRDLIIGIMCHAIYHAGQVQLLKRLQGA